VDGPPVVCGSGTLAMTATLRSWAMAASGSGPFSLALHLRLYLNDPTSRPIVAACDFVDLRC
jgi:hypothetical protein